MDRREWILRRNCSLAPRQLALAFAAPCIVSIAIAMIFMRHGAWHILFFALLESSAVATAFVYHARHVADHERIALSGGSLTIELVRGGVVMTTRLDPARTRVVPPCRSRELIRLETGKASIDVGRFVSAERRREVAQDLSRELAAEGLACDVER